MTNATTGEPSGRHRTDRAPRINALVAMLRHPRHGYAHPTVGVVNVLTWTLAAERVRNHTDR